MRGDDVIVSDEEVDLAGAGDFVAGIPQGEVHDEEEIVIVLVKLGTFDGAAEVFEIEGVEVREAVAQVFDVFGAGQDEVEPGEGFVLDDSRAHGGYYGWDGARGQVSHPSKSPPINQGRLGSLILSLVDSG